MQATLRIGISGLAKEYKFIFFPFIPPKMTKRQGFFPVSVVYFDY